ncbi:MAG: acyl-CoA dehydrogenase family protein [Dehalococcoidia bacterium]
MAEYNIEHYLEAARGLATRVAANADRIDSERRIPPDLAGALADQGLFKLLVPHSLGGAEMDLPDFLRVIEVFACADASTAWCLSQNNVFATHAVRIPEPTAREIWGDGRAVVSNGPPTSAAKAVPVEGGYKLSGHWDFSSGSGHATWVAALTPVADSEKGLDRSMARRNPLTMLIPKQEVNFLDLWEVNGLRGTGSFSFEVEDLFVPDLRAFSANDTPWETGSLYIIPRTLLFGSGNATVALGVAQASLTTVLKLIGSSSPSRPATLLPDRSANHRVIGEAEAIWRSARAFLRESALAVWEEACDSHLPPAEDRLRLRLAITHAITMSARVVEMAYSLCGSSAIFAGNPIQRLFQDMHVITQHIQGRATHYETAGQFLLGLNPEGSY